MGSTRVFIPDDPRAPERVEERLKDVEGVAERYGHQTVPRPLNNGWMVRIDGGEDDEEMDKIYSSHVVVGVGGPAARVHSMKPLASAEASSL